MMVKVEYPIEVNRGLGLDDTTVRYALIGTGQHVEMFDHE